MSKFDFQKFLTVTDEDRHQIDVADKIMEMKEAYLRQVDYTRKIEEIEKIHKALRR